MNEEMDYLFFELWHHEGRRVRHGASVMGGPDYTQWDAFYELTKHFYTEFLPLSPEQRQEMLDFERENYESRGQD